MTLAYLVSNWNLAVPQTVSAIGKFTPGVGISSDARYVVEDLEVDPAHRAPRDAEVILNRRHPSIDAKY